MAELPEPHFVDRDLAVIRAQMVAKYEELADAPLLPSQRERLLIDIAAYFEMLNRVAIQEAAKQNLVAYANYPMIDLLAQLVGGERLAATPARAPFEVTIETVHATDVLVAASGFRVRSTDGRVTFALARDATVLAGELTVTVDGVCTVPGVLGNGYDVGQVSELVDTPLWPCAVSNTEETQAGAASETTPQLRARIPDISASTSTAGPRRGYRAHAKAAHPDIVDVAVTNPAPGVVRLTVLTKTGLPDPEVLDLVLEACNDEDVRPLCDTVEAFACVEVPYTIECGLVLQKGAQADVVLTLALEAIQIYTDGRGAMLGRTPQLSKVLKALEVPGVYSVVPAAGWLLPDVAAAEWAHCTNLDITILGVTEESGE